MIAAANVRPATDADHGPLVGVLAEVFSTDPALCWFIPGERRRTALLRLHFRALVPLYVRAGAIWVAERPAGAALWVAHGRYPFSQLDPMLERCDAERMPAYLNASTARSRDLYARHGFELQSEFRLPFGGPPLWRMWRPGYASTSSPVSAS